MTIFSTTTRLLFIIQKRSLKTSAPIRPLSKDSNFTLQFLTNSCGLPLQSAISVSQKFQLDQKNQKKLLSVINLFKDQGFNQTQIANLIERKPALLHCRINDNLKPKLEFLKENGFVGEVLIQLLITNYRRRIGSNMKPTLEFLKSHLVSDKKVGDSLRRSCCWAISKDTMQCNIDFLLKHGMNDYGMSYLIECQPTTLMQSRERLAYGVSVVKKLGFEPSGTMFVHALRVVMCMSESTWKAKVDVLRSFGCGEEEILLGFKKDPLVMAASEAKLRKAMDFYVNTMKVDWRVIIGYPKLLMFSVDSRIRPRYAVFKILQSKKLLNEDVKIVWLFCLTEKVFLSKYVVRYESVIPGLLDLYNSSKARKMSTCHVEDK